MAKKRRKRPRGRRRLPSLESSRRIENKYNKFLQQQVRLIDKLTAKIIRELPAIIARAAKKKPGRKDSVDRFDAWEVDPYYDPGTGRAFYAELIPELDTHPTIEVGDADDLPFVAPLALRSDAETRAFDFRVIDDVIKDFRIQYGKGVSEVGAQQFLEGLEIDVEKESARQWRAHTSEAAKASKRVSEAAVQFAVSESSGLAVNPRRKFISQNIKLINLKGGTRVPGIPDRHARVMRQVLKDGIGRQLRVESIRDKLKHLQGITKRRAETIARDQIGKYHGQMMEERQAKLGVRSYIWRTVGDERVREEHEERDDVVFRWDKPPKDGHPGQPVNCRCSAEPNLEGELAHLESQ